MTLRSITQFTVHLQSFRNIELWYQGIYYVTIQIFYQHPITNKIINAHPFAHTQNFHKSEQSGRFYDHQIFKPSFICQSKSKFVSKSFIVKYYEQQIELNDICHFRIETQLSDYNNPKIYMQASLMFIDLQQRKNIEKIGAKQLQQFIQKQAKVGKCRKYHLFQANSGISQFVPLLFDDNFFSLVNMSVHSVCLDFRFRISDLQISQFSRLSYQQKMQLIQANKIVQKDKKKVSYYDSILKSLKINDSPQALKTIEKMLINNMKDNHNNLLQRYRALFTRVITDHQKKIYQTKLINPINMELFEIDNNENNMMNIGRGAVSNAGSIRQMPFQFNPINPQNANNQAQFKKNPEKYIEKVLNEINLVAAQIFKLYNCYIDVFRVAPKYAISYLQSEYHQKKEQFWNKILIKRDIIGHNIFITKDQHDNCNLQKSALKSKGNITLNTKVQQDFFVSKIQQIPLLFSNRYFTADNDLSPKDKVRMHRQQQILAKEKLVIKDQPIFGDIDTDGIHLIVFVHGFQGNSYDMRLIKNYISFLYPESMFLCATANQQLTDTDIMQMGVRLAGQIKTFIKDNFTNDTLSKLSFIGHSLGGVKIRACLPHLLQYKNKFHCLMTLSSPHLGYKINSSSVVGAGMWVLQKMKNSICLKQLSMTDNQIPQQTCLYKLSETQGVQYFKYIFLLSSKQDSYAPFESARIEIKQQFLQDQRKSIHNKMVENILKNVKSGVLRRINVFFEIGQKNLDSLIGRTAHIKFLESQELIKAILYTQKDLLA